VGIEKLLSTDNSKTPMQQDAEHQWPLAIRGIAALLMGVIILGLLEAEKVAPVILVYVFALFCELGGAVSGMESIVANGHIKRWWPMAAEGGASALIGTLMLKAHAAVTMAFPWFVGLWAILCGIFQLFWAKRFHDTYFGHWFFYFPGSASLVLGITVVAVPNPGVRIISWTLGCYGIFFGAILMVVTGYLKAMADKARSESIPSKPVLPAS
jgi:uncharacterized membrane protein HdeD (DUF308 family)